MQTMLLLIAFIHICAAQWTQLGGDIDGETAWDRFGSSVSLSNDGTILAVGAPPNNDIVDLSGHVRVYKYVSNQDQWTQLGQDIDGEGEDDDSGLSVSLNSAGTRLAVGAQENGASNTGHVRVYEYVSNQDQWTQLGQDIDGEAAYDNSGWSVSLSNDGSILAVGAPYNDNNGNNYAGHVRVYEWCGVSGQWIQLGVDIDGDGGDYFGWSVSLNSDGSRLAVGAPSVNNNNAGLVRVYEWCACGLGGQYIQLGQDIDGEAAWDESGLSVSLSNDGRILAVGAPGDNNNAGLVRVYKYVNNGWINQWIKLGQDIDGEAAWDGSGLSVSLSNDGTRLAVGAPENVGNNGGYSVGHVRVYEYDSNQWTQLGSDIDGEAAGDRSGASVSLNSDGSILAVGAPYNNGNGADSGHVRVYNHQTPQPTPSPTISPTDKPTTSKPTPKPTIK